MEICAQNKNNSTTDVVDWKSIKTHTLLHTKDLDWLNGASDSKLGYPQKINN